MSRIGRLPVTIPDGVEVSLDHNHLSVTGARGTLERVLPAPMRIEMTDGVIVVARPTDSAPHRSLPEPGRRPSNHVIAFPCPLPRPTFYATKPSRR